MCPDHCRHSNWRICMHRYNCVKVLDFCCVRWVTIMTLLNDMLQTESHKTVHYSIVLYCSAVM